MPKNDIFLAGPRSWKSSNFFDFLESLLKWWKSPPLDHRTLEMCIFADLGEKYAKMWNTQKWQFVAGPRSWKSLNLSTFWKAFKNDENHHHQLTTGLLKCAYLLIWVRNMQKCEMPKNDNLLQVSGHENLQIFRLSGKPLKMMETTTSWPQDPWNAHICWFGWEKCKNVKCPKMTFSSQVRGHENLQIFRLSGKPLKMIKTTTSWQQDPWNVHICWFGWEICKNVKCPKMTFFSQVRGHENH